MIHSRAVSARRVQHVLPDALGGCTLRMTLPTVLLADRMRGLSTSTSSALSSSPGVLLLAQLSPSLRPWYSRCSRSPPDYGKTPPHLLERVPSLVLHPLRVALDVAVALGDVQPRLSTCSMSGLLHNHGHPILDELFRERGGLPDQPFPS